jgi:hypothetical protein
MSRGKPQSKDLSIDLLKSWDSKLLSRYFGNNEALLRLTKGSCTSYLNPEEE